MAIDNGKIKLSIVIPYFETLELTRKLLLNLLIQYHYEIEIIVIDDNVKQDYRLDKYINFLEGNFNL